jgi:hypothetical protein
MNDLIFFIVVAGTKGFLLVWHSRSVLRFLRSRFGIPIIVIRFGLFVHAWIKPVLLDSTYGKVPPPKSFKPFTAEQPSEIHFQRPSRRVSDSRLVGVVHRVSSLQPNCISVRAVSSRRIDHFHF